MTMITMVGMTLYITIFMATILLFYAAVAIVKAFKERNRLREEVEAMHDRSNRVSRSYLAAREDLERQLREVRAKATNERWERDMLIESYQADIKALKKQIAMKDKILKQTDELLAKERAKASEA